MSKIEKLAERSYWRKKEFKLAFDHLSTELLREYWFLILTQNQSFPQLTNINVYVVNNKIYLDFSKIDPAFVETLSASRGAC